MIDSDVTTLVSAFSSTVNCPLLLMFSGLSSNPIPSKPYAHPCPTSYLHTRSIKMKTWGNLCLCITSFLLFFFYKMLVPIYSLNIILKHPHSFSSICLILNLCSIISTQAPLSFGIGTTKRCNNLKIIMVRRTT